MIRLADNLWIGDSAAVEHGDLEGAGIDAVLNVACDLEGKRGWADGVEYVQVGLTDGPGNEEVWYCAAVLVLVGLTRRAKSVLVYDHDGGRATVLAMMYLNLICGKYRADPLSWSHWMTWDERVAEVEARIGRFVRRPHLAHIEVFSKIPYSLLEAFL